MVENIVQKNEAGAGTENGWFKLPKHMKQMGLPGNNPEIYIEDYAEGYLRRLAGSDYTECRVAVLVGEFIKSEGKRYVFIRGAIETEDVFVENKIRFTSEVWTSVYEKIKRYFPQYEAVGWFLGGPEFLTEVTDEIRKIHVDWFGGRDRVLFKIDPVEKEALFYLYEKGDLKQWPGYCIYYEKNEEMQDYLVAGAPPSVDAGYTEPVLAEISKKVGRKEDTKEEERENPSGVRRAESEDGVAKPSESSGEKTSGKMNSGHGAGIAAALALLAIGAFALKGKETGLFRNDGRTTPALVSTAEVMPTEAIAEDKNQEQALQVNAGVSATPVAELQQGVEGNLLEGEFVPLTEAPYNYDEKEITENVTSSPATPTEQPVPTETPEPEREEAETDSSGLRCYVVKKGDTLAGICREFYGDILRMEEIKGINQITDENWIYAGQELYLP